MSDEVNKKSVTEKTDAEERASSIVKPLRTFQKDLDEAKLRAERAGKKIDEKEYTAFRKQDKNKKTTPSKVHKEKLIPQQPIAAQKTKYKSPPEQKQDTKATAPQQPKQPQPKLQEQVDIAIKQTLKIKKKDSSSLSPIRTYKYDTAELIKNKHESVVSIAAAESKKRAKKHYAPQPEVSPSFLENNLAIVAVSLLFIVAGSALTWFFITPIEPTQNRASQTENSPVIFSDNSKELDVTTLRGIDLLRFLAKEGDEASLSLGAILHLDLVRGGIPEEISLTTEQFFAKIGGSVPDKLVRFLEPSFMLGIHGSTDHQPFLILKTSSFENAFASMLEWEENMNKDLSPLFGPVLTNTTLTLPTGEEVSTTRIVIPRVFNDVVVRNVDTRLLRDDRGDIALLYAFPNAKTIIITTNENTFFEVFRRMTTSRNQN